MATVVRGKYLHTKLLGTGGGGDRGAMCVRGEGPGVCNLYNVLQELFIASQRLPYILQNLQGSYSYLAVRAVCFIYHV